MKAISRATSRLSESTVRSCSSWSVASELWHLLPVGATKHLRWNEVLAVRVRERRVFAWQFQQQSLGRDMRRFVAVAMLASALTGCGTNLNFCLPKDHSGEMPSGPPRLEVYGGVSTSVEMAQKCSQENGVRAKLVAAFVLADVPLSAIGDTLTLPITVSVTIARAIDARRESPPAPVEFKRFSDEEKNKPSPLTPESTHGGIADSMP